MSRKNEKQPLYVFDIDRTLKPIIGPIPHLTKKAIKALVKKENVAIATGRSYEEAINVAKTLHIDYLITNGGSEVYVQGKRIYQYPLDLKEELENLKRENPIHLIYTDQGVYSSHFPSLFKIWSCFQCCFSKKSSGYHLFKMLGTVQLKDVPEDAYVYKIFVFSKYQSQLFYRHQIFHLKHFEFEDKAQGVQVLKEILDAGQIICFGDSQNDLTLFKIADQSYAMKHGSQRLKAMATEVIGFRWGIYRIVMKKAE